MIQLAVIPGPSASLGLSLQAHWKENKAGSLGSSFHCLLQTPSVCVRVLQLPINSPAPGCRGGPRPQ